MKLLRTLKIVHLLSVILLSGCSSASREIPDTVVPGTEATAALQTPSAEGETFKTYHNPQAGYSAEYPADWTVSEQVGEDGSIITTFSPSDGSAGVLVMVQSGDLGGGASDLPNTRCEEVRVGELTGMRCFDTINQIASTTIVANGKTYTITPLGKHLEESLYSRFLSGFQIIQ